MPAFFERDWLSDNISFQFGGTPYWNTSGWISSFSNPNSSLTAQLNTALTYIQSIIDVHFSFTGAGEIKAFNGVMVNPNIDGLTLHDNGSIATHADVFIRSSESSNDGLVLHELGHALGLGHTTAYNSLSLTLMNPNYTSAQLFNVGLYGAYDLAQLNGAFGSSEAYTGNWSGTPWADTLYGGIGIDDPNDGSEQIFGFEGNDKLYGNGGNDTVYGGSGVTDSISGADTLYGGGGNDFLYGNGGDDVIFGGGAVTDPSNNPDTIYGGLGNDLIYGNGGNDLLNGADGNDTIYAGVGVDTLTGGTGADQFYIQVGDIVTDYQAGVDSLFYV